MPTIPAPVTPQQWVAALRSGEYTQTGYVLRNGDSFCCLGVLADLQGAEWKPCPTARRPIKPDYKGFIASVALDDRRQDDARPAWLGADMAEHLSGLNDNGYTFEELADTIEQDIANA